MQCVLFGRQDAKVTTTDNSLPRAESEPGGPLAAIDVISDAFAGANELPSDPALLRVLDVIPAHVYLLGADGGLRYANKHWSDYIGGEAFTQDDVGRAFHPSDRKAIREAFAEALADHSPHQVEMRIRRADGEFRWHLARTVPLFDEGGRLYGWVGANVDIHDRKYLEESERFLGLAGQVLAGSLEPASVLDQLARMAIPFLGDGSAIDVLRADGSITCAAVAHTIEEVEQAARTMRMKHPPQAGGPHPVARVIASGEPMVVQTDQEFLEGVAQDAEHLALARKLSSTVGLTVPIQARGKVLGAITVYRADPLANYSEREVMVTTDLGRRAGLALDNARLFDELQRRADELAAANDVKDQFLGLVSHELRTPLTTVLGNANSLYSHLDRVSHEDLRSGLADIRSGARRLRELVENMLLLSRVEQQTAMELEPVLLQRQLKVLAGEGLGSLERVRFAVEPGVPPVLAQPVYLGQVLTNLVGNALKYSAGRVDVTAVERPDGKVLITVEDSGEGVKDAEIPRLFEAFFRAESNQRQAPGIGIGLAVCKRLVEVQGGESGAERLEPQGMRFWFTLEAAR